MTKQFNKEKVSITLDREIYEYISEIAAKDDRSVSSMINVILRDFMRDSKDKD